MRNTPSRMPLPGSVRAPARQRRELRPGHYLALLGLGSALGIAIPITIDHIETDSNTLKTCDINWELTTNAVEDESVAHAALQTGRTLLADTMRDQLGTRGVTIYPPGLTTPVRDAAELLYGHDNINWYTLDEPKLTTPRAEFCEDSTSIGVVYKTPDYVRAEAALLAAGIDINAEAGAQ